MRHCCKSLWAFLLLLPALIAGCGKPADYRARAVLEADTANGAALLQTLWSAPSIMTPLARFSPAAAGIVLHPPRVEGNRVTLELSAREQETALNALSVAVIHLTGALEAQRETARRVASIAIVAP